MKILYPGGKTKALTFSFGDGKIHDRRIVQRFEKYGLKGTFHLNSGRLGKEPFVSARGNCTAVCRAGNCLPWCGTQIFG